MEREQDDNPKHAPDLSEEEQKEVGERGPASAHVVHETIRKEGEDELKRPSSALAWSGLAAGMSMGFSLVAEGLLRSHLPDEPWRPLVSKLGYSLGFLIVVLGRQQLFTENTLTPILPLLARRELAVLKNVARLWVVVLLANLLGALIFAWVIGRTEAFDPDIRAAFEGIGREALEPSAGTILMRGIFAGWLIALMVWLLPFAETARVWVIILLTYIVGLGAFSHIIAGSVEVMFMAVIGAASWTDALLHFMLPTLLGNIVGGVLLVAAINHAQVIAGSGADA